MSSEIIAAAPSDVCTTDASHGSQLRLALVCDYLEEGWPSMDLFGDMLATCYVAGHAPDIAAEQLRPPFHPRFSRLPFSGYKRSFLNADRLLNRHFDYGRWLKKQSARFDLFHLMDHSYSQLVHELPGDRTVVTCHDLDTFRCLLEPDLEPRPRWFRSMAQRTLNGFLQCAHVICPSNATRTQLLRQRLFPQDRMTVIPPGVDPVFFADPDPAVSRAVEKLTGCAPRAYLLHVGSTIRRKRIDLLLHIFARVSATHPEIVLLRVGGPFTADQAQLAASLGISGKIVQAPRLTNEQLAAAYRNAALLLQTSDAEGFGLPVIEASACGCVVVASDIPALREAGGAPPEYCAVADLEAWCATVTRLLDESGTTPHHWEARRANARRHASGFTWPENARRTAVIYRHICGGAAGSSLAGPRPATVSIQT